MNLQRLNIGIIGGGIGGVAAAVALHRAGIQATVYARATEQREVGAGMMLWPNATRVLKELGLLERVAALSGPSQHFLVRSSAGAILMDRRGAQRVCCIDIDNEIDLVHPVVPPHVDYSLTPAGNKFAEAVALLCEWAEQNKALLKQVAGRGTY
jgi:2-polyprenyl-6-methoxyphenol hydroxylase-like FAD-dependent oxidoreductase